MPIIMKPTREPRIGSNADLFASRGDPMDSRVPIEFGLTKEPARYRSRNEPDGSLRRTEVSDSEWMWDYGRAPQAAIRKRAFHEKPPSDEVRARSADARRACVKRIAAIRGKTYAHQADPEPQPHLHWWDTGAAKALQDEPSPIHAQSHADWQQFIAAEKAANKARRQAAVGR